MCVRFINPKQFAMDPRLLQLYFKNKNEGVFIKKIVYKNERLIQLESPVYFLAKKKLFKKGSDSFPPQFHQAAMTSLQAVLLCYVQSFCTHTKAQVLYVCLPTNAVTSRQDAKAQTGSLVCLFLFKHFERRPYLKKTINSGEL